MKQICIIGPSGTGKTTLAKYIAARYRIPFISGSSRQFTEKLGIVSHSDFIRYCGNEPGNAINLYNQIINHREGITDDNINFVTDRGVIDAMVYFYLQLLPHIELGEEAKMIESMKQILNDTNVTYIFIPYNLQHSVEDNGHRIINPVYQKMMTHAFQTVIRRHMPNVNVIEIDEWGWEERVKIVNKLFRVPLRKRIRNYIQRIWQKEKQ